MEVYYLDEWIIITLHVVGFLHPAIFWYFHHSSVKSGLKVADCAVQSAVYWCFYGTAIESINLIYASVLPHKLYFCILLDFDWTSILDFVYTIYIPGILSW